MPTPFGIYTNLFLGGDVILNFYGQVNYHYSTGFFNGDVWLVRFRWESNWPREGLRPLLVSDVRISLRQFLIFYSFVLTQSYFWIEFQVICVFAFQDRDLENSCGYLADLHITCQKFLCSSLWFDTGHYMDAA